jgi:hypothetical protein
VFSKVTTAQCGRRSIEPPRRCVLKLLIVEKHRVRVSVQPPYSALPPRTTNCADRCRDPFRSPDSSMMRTSGAQNIQARQHDLRENAAGELERFPPVRCFADHLHLVFGDDTRDASRRMPHGTQGE